MPSGFRLFFARPAVLAAALLSGLLVSCSTLAPGSTPHAAVPAEDTPALDPVSPLNPSEAARRYAAQVTALVQRHIVLTAPVDGDPATEVEVRTGADGSITGTRIVKGSGVQHWDDAVLLAIGKAGKIPPDVDGKIPTVVLIRFRPKMIFQKFA
ncbi:MAG: energy transducer TonB [Pseudomonadota bacterium]